MQLPRVLPGNSKEKKKVFQRSGWLLSAQTRLAFPLLLYSCRLCLFPAALSAFVYLCSSSPSCCAPSHLVFYVCFCSASALDHTPSIVENKRPPLLSRCRRYNLCCRIKGQRGYDVTRIEGAEGGGGERARRAEQGSWEHILRWSLLHVGAFGLCKGGKEKTRGKRVRQRRA